MQSPNESGPPVTVQAVEERFPRECSDCRAELRGVLIQQELLTAEDIAEIFGPAVSPRTAKAWLREEWSRSFLLPGVRHRFVDARQFVTSIEDRKREPGRGRRPLRQRGARPSLLTSCPRCEVELHGFIAPLELLTVPDIVTLLGGTVPRATIQAWIWSGLLRGFKLKGVRGLLVEVSEFSDDFEIMKRHTADLAGATSMTRRGRS